MTSRKPRGGKTDWAGRAITGLPQKPRLMVIRGRNAKIGNTSCGKSNSYTWMDVKSK